MALIVINRAWLTRKTHTRLVVETRNTVATISIVYCVLTTVYWRDSTTDHSIICSALRALATLTSYIKEILVAYTFSSIPDRVSWTLLTFITNFIKTRITDTSAT